MTAEQYVNAIVKKIQCGKNRRQEIRQQLLSDISVQTAQGRTLDDVIQQMGSASEIAESFNEDISEAERKKYRRAKRLKIFVSTAAVLALLAAGVSLYLPKSTPIEKSAHFQKDAVETCMKETVALLDAGSYAALQERAARKMQPVLTDARLSSAKKQLSENWGERKSFGKCYLTELSQFGKHFAVGEITAVYEHVTVTYRLTYDADLKLTGLYMR